MVMGGDSRSKGRGFESRHRILDGHFFTYICCKNCIVCLKRLKINEKEAGVGPFFKKTFLLSRPSQDVFLQPLIPVTLFYLLYYGFTILGLPCSKYEIP